jgi:predicted amino acid-binding ACT domain protein
LDDGRVINVVGEDNLGLAVNMESQLASHISSFPAINFLAYIPKR